ncbi:hypothetical protein FKM82_011649 [Ascaphus truei]
MELKEDSRMMMNDGHKIPIIGFGTYTPQKDHNSLPGHCTEFAIEIGYRHIDCAFIYGSELQVGRAIQAKIRDGTTRRKDLFYTGKLWGTFQAPDKVRPALEKSLKNLQLEYIDLFLINAPRELKPGEDLIPVDENAPSDYQDSVIRKTWEAMEACKDAGLVKSIGVCNFKCSQLELFLSKPGLKHKPVCNQVECHIYLNKKKMLALCKYQDIVLVGYCVLESSKDEKWIDQDNPVLLEDPVLNTIAKKHRRTPAQVAIRYLLQRGIVVLARSFKYNGIKENFRVFDFHLSAEDMRTLDALSKHMHYVKTSHWEDYQLPI